MATAGLLMIVGGLGLVVVLGVAVWWYYRDK